MVSEGLIERCAEALGWSVRDARSFSIPTLREMVRGVSPKLADELTQAMSGKSYICDEPEQPKHRRVR